jgi:hypothetical protein
MRVPFATELSDEWWAGMRAIEYRFSAVPGGNLRRRPDDHLPHPVSGDAQLDELHEQPRARGVRWRST